MIIFYKWGCDSEDYQIQILNQRQDFILVFLADECLDLFKGDVSFLGFKGFRLEFPSDKPVGYVDVVFHIFGCGIGLKKVAHADVEVREVLDFLAPGCVTVHVWESDHITAVQDFQSLVELALSPGGQPKIVRHQSAADDLSLFQFNLSLFLRWDFTLKATRCM